MYSTNLPKFILTGSRLGLMLETSESCFNIFYDD